jgi:hypothetical protein
VPLQKALHILALAVGITELSKINTKKQPQAQIAQRADSTQATPLTVSNNAVFETPVMHRTKSSIGVVSAGRQGFLTRKWK